MEQINAAVREHGQELDDVEIGDQGVGQLDEHPAEALQVRHHRPPCLGAFHGFSSIILNVAGPASSWGSGIMDFPVTRSAGVRPTTSAATSSIDRSQDHA